MDQKILLHKYFFFACEKRFSTNRSLYKFWWRSHVQTLTSTFRTITNLRGPYVPLRALACLRHARARNGTYGPQSFIWTTRKKIYNRYPLKNRSVKSVLGNQNFVRRDRLCKSVICNCHQKTELSSKKNILQIINQSQEAINKKQLLVAITNLQITEVRGQKDRFCKRWWQLQIGDLHNRPLRATLGQNRIDTSILAKRTFSESKTYHVQNQISAVPVDSGLQSRALFKVENSKTKYASVMPKGMGLRVRAYLKSIALTNTSTNRREPTLAFGGVRHVWALYERPYKSPIYMGTYMRSFGGVRKKLCFLEQNIALAHMRTHTPFGGKGGNNGLRLRDKVNPFVRPLNNILLSISGGQDSIFLLFCLSFLQTQIAFKPKIIWCNHFWQKVSFYTTLHLTKSALAFSCSIVGFLPFYLASRPRLYKTFTTSFFIPITKKDKPGILRLRNLNTLPRGFPGSRYTEIQKPCFLKQYKSTYVPVRALTSTNLRFVSRFVLVWARTGFKNCRELKPQRGIRQIPDRSLRLFIATKGIAFKVHTAKKKSYFFQTKSKPFKSFSIQRFAKQNRLRALTNRLTSHSFVWGKHKKAELCPYQTNIFALQRMHGLKVKREKCSFSSVKGKSSFFQPLQNGAFCTLSKIKPNNLKRSSRKETQFTLQNKAFHTSTNLRFVRANDIAQTNFCSERTAPLCQAKFWYIQNRYALCMETFKKQSLYRFRSKNNFRIAKVKWRKRKSKGYKKFVENISETLARNWRHITTERACTFYDFNLCVYGHTLSDRIETILFNLIRGAGNKALQPLPWKRRHSNFCYNRFYPTLEQVAKNTHITRM